MSTNTLELGREYVRRGWAIIPLPPKSKIPNRKGWQNERLSLDDLVKHFSNGANIGLLCGEPSGGLVDVDCDVPEAVATADTFLPCRPLGSCMGVPVIPSHTAGMSRPA